MEARDISIPVTIEEEYENLREDIRAELIDGRIVMLAFPLGKHYDAAGEIYSQLKQYLRGKRCRVYQDYRVQLRAGADKYNYFRPDVSLVCDSSKLGADRIVGAPDMTVEVLSPSNKNHDRVYKRRVYLKAGVREYWIVDLDKRTVDVLLLRDGKYVAATYHPDDIVKVSVLDDCSIDMAYVFPQEEYN